MYQRLVFAFTLALALPCIAIAQTAAPVKEKPAAKSAATPKISVVTKDTPGVGPIRTEDPKFHKLWNERRTHFAELKPEQMGAVVFFGDSITQGWKDDFRKNFPSVKTANRGISGDTTRGLIARIEEDVLAHDPRAIVMLIGTNDIGRGVSPADIAGNMKIILDKIAAHDPKTPVILCAVMPSSASKDRPADKIRELNQRVAEIAQDYKNVTIVDTYTLFANKEGDAPADLFPDLLHPNDAGYKKWTAALLPLFATLGIVDTEPDTFKPEDGFELLFNGHDLTGWGYRPTGAADRAMVKKWVASGKLSPAYPIVDEAVNFDGKSASADGRYRAINGRLVVTTPSEGRSIQQLATTRDFSGDFTLKLDFRATPNADSGVFIRGKQLQCRDYPLAGPYKDLKNYKPGDWNELEVKVVGNKAHCTCNGEVIEAAYELPEKGPIGLEGDRGQMEYRRIRISR